MKALKHLILGGMLAMSLAQPAQAGIPTIDGGHIGLQAVQWFENLQQWINDANRWVSGMKSAVSDLYDVASMDFGEEAKKALFGTHEADLKDVVDKMELAKPCAKIPDTEAKALCETEQKLKIMRAQVLVDALKEAGPVLKQIETKAGTYNSTVGKAQAAIANITGLIGGTSASTDQGKSESQRAEIQALQTKVSNIMSTAKTKMDGVTSQLEIVHNLRVDYGRTQVEGKAPGIFTKLVTTGFVAAALEEDELKYKNKIENEKKRSSKY